MNSAAGEKTGAYILSDGKSDETFPKKCRDKTNEFKAEGKTIVFVSHVLNTVKELCQRSIFLHEGRIVIMGDTENVINDYREMLQRK